MESEQRLLLLGALQAERAGQVVHGFESRRAQALLGYLAAQGRPQTREYLADVFWPEKSHTRGHSNLSRVLHNLRALLPGCVSVDHNTVTFNTQVCWLDISAFANLTRTASQVDSATLQEAISLYRGDFMAGIHLTDCVDFERWLFVERAHWEQRITHALYILTAYYIDQGDIAAGLHTVDQLLTIAPWHEEAHCQKMILLARSGHRSTALRQYAICRQIMKNELDAITAPETDALYRRILAGDVRQLIPVRFSET